MCCVWHPFNRYGLAGRFFFYFASFPCIYVLLLFLLVLGSLGILPKSTKCVFDRHINSFFFVEAIDHRRLNLLDDGRCIFAWSLSFIIIINFVFPWSFCYRIELTRIFFPFFSLYSVASTALLCSLLPFNGTYCVSWLIVFNGRQRWEMLSFAYN